SSAADRRPASPGQLRCQAAGPRGPGFRQAAAGHRPGCPRRRRPTAQVAAGGTTMKRFLVLPLTAGLLSLATGAWSSTPSDQDVERAQQLRRNRGLIQKLVDGSLRLAKAEEPLQQAEGCHFVAQELASEIEQAATQQEGTRAG